MWCSYKKIPKQFVNSGIEDLPNLSKAIHLPIHSAMFWILSTLNMYVSSITHDMLILLLEPSLEPLEMVNIRSLLIWNLFKLLFVFLDLRVNLKLLLKKVVRLHGIIFPIPALSSKIIIDSPSKDDMSITARMQKWTEEPYVVESSNSEEDNDDDVGDEEDNDLEADY
ncbi:unnamed protein product [Lactuca saligna]|uniref:Uncharacterized protein n=1 Tax=Lactuca saligna TaxID=75948 RepID=A0AA36A1D1_LACSI|nr:unnamed protein product [Lactuca saligna]